MRRATIMTALLALLALDCTAACKPVNPMHPSRGPMPYTSVGDGSWTAPDELRAGLWRSRDDLAAKPDCGWFTTPPAPTVSAPDERGRVSVGVDGRTVKSLTSLHCGDWDWIGER